MPKVERQLRWNAISEEDPLVHHFYFLIINDNRGADRIEQKAKEVLQPTAEMHSLVEGAIRGTKLRYKLLKFESYRKNLNEISWGSIYSKKVIRDRELVDRKNPDGLVGYVDSFTRAFS